MTHHLYAPLVSQFRVEAPESGLFRKFLSRLFPRAGRGRPAARKLAAPRVEGYKSQQPDGLAMLEREVNRIRLESRHWLM